LVDSLVVSQYLSTLDWTVFLIILAVTFGYVVYGLLKKDHSNNSIVELLVMGRRLTLPLFVSTLVATWYGGIFGVTEIAFNQGIYNFVTQGFFWYLAYFIFAFFIIDRLNPQDALTLPDLLTQKVGPRAGKIGGLFNVLNLLPTAYAISLGHFIQTLFGLGFELSMALGLTVVCLYSLFGGLRAVVYSDVIQFFVMCSSVVLVFIFSYSEYGGISFLQKNLPPHYFSITGKIGWGTTIVWGFLALGTLVDPNFYQRCLASKNLKTAKTGILLSTLVWVCFDLSVTFGAMYAKAIIPKAEASKGYLYYALQLLPSGWRGFFLAGILATVLSTLDSYLFLAGGIFSHNVMPKRLAHRPITHYLGVIGAVIITFFLSLFFDGSVRDVWLVLGSLSTASLLLPMLSMYLFPGKVRDLQFFVAALCGATCVVIWSLVPKSGFMLNVDALYPGMLGSFLGLVVMRLFRPSNP
jgi:SSS family solute:Na+ symporter